MKLITVVNNQKYEQQRNKIMEKREVLISTLFAIMEDAASGYDLCDLCLKNVKCKKGGINRCLQTVAQNL